MPVLKEPPENTSIAAQRLRQAAFSFVKHNGSQADSNDTRGQRNNWELLLAAQGYASQVKKAKAKPGLVVTNRLVFRQPNRKKFLLLADTFKLIWDAGWVSEIVSYDATFPFLTLTAYKKRPRKPPRAG